MAHYANILLERELMQYHLFFDNWFTSVKLVSYLKSIKVEGTGTVKRNRTENCPLKTVDEMSKSARGTMDHRVDVDEEIMVMSWTDNGVVNVCSNSLGIDPTSTVQRYAASQKKHVSVQQPNAIHHYNQHMGGVDQMDQNINTNRVAIRGKKWYSALITYFLDVAVNNAW